MTHNFPTPEHERLAREGMYHPESERDACGVDLIAATDGKPSRRVVATGIEALKAVWHRGASLVVWAIRDGRDVTEHMHKWLQAKLHNKGVAA